MTEIKKKCKNEVKVRFEQSLSEFKFSLNEFSLSELKLDNSIFSNLNFRGV